MTSLENHEGGPSFLDQRRRSEKRSASTEWHMLADPVMNHLPDEINAKTTSGFLETAY